MTRRPRAPGTAPGRAAGPYRDHGVGRDGEGKWERDDARLATPDARVRGDGRRETGDGKREGRGRKGENTALLESDMRAAKALKHDRKEGLTGCVSREAILNAVRTEGIGVLGTGAKGYWDDMKRRYPHLNLSGRPAPDGCNLAGTRNRLGVVKWRSRISEGRLVREKRENGRWVEDKDDGMSRLRRELAGE